MGTQRLAVRGRVPGSPGTTVLAGALLAALALAACLAGAVRAEKGVNEGTFRDRDGKAHPWSVERGHLLLWDDKPYTPAGVVFHSAYLGAPGPETLRRDEEELDRLKAAGVEDLWVDPPAGLLKNSPEATQTLLDALESRGFRYGLRVGDRAREPLIGFSPVNPAIRVPVSRFQPGARESWEVPAPRGRRMLYALVNVVTPDERTQDFPAAVGEALVEKDRALIEVQIRQSKLLGKSRGLLLTVPEVQVEPEELGSFGDLWSGMEDYSARLMRHMKALKFGPGFRFLLDPFATGDGTVGQEDLVFPSSDAFRIAFREWLSRRVGVHSLNVSWRLNDRRIQSLEQAARLVPMWSRNDPPDGDGWLFDPVDRAVYRCVPRQCSIWTDLDNFRADTLKRWMNTTATVLKQDVVGAPVLFTWAAYHPLFNNSPAPGGYDGLAAQLYGSGPALGRDQAAYALAQAEEADRNTWLIAARLSGPPDATGEPTPLPDGVGVRTAWSALRDTGFRGVFLDPRLTPNAPAAVQELESAMAADLPVMRKPVPVCFFPMFLASADRVMRLSNGVWWLPSAAPARLLRYGDTLMGYEMARPLGSDFPLDKGTVLWSTSGKQEVTFYVDRFTRIQLFDSAGKPIEARPKRSILRIDLSEEPIIAAGLDVEAMFPVELALAQLKTFGDLVAAAEGQRLDVAAMRTLYDQARKNLSSSNAANIYNSITPYVGTLRETLMPFVWVEAERPTAHNFSGLSFQAGSSAGTYLKLDRRDPPVTGVYRARYVVDVVREASYEIWVAGRVPGRPGVSPLVWQIDDEPPASLDKADPVGEDYAGGMAWFQLGRATLKAGRHELVVAVPRPADGPSGRFVAGLDAVVFSRDRFQPRGVEKPVLKLTPLPKPEKPAGKSRDEKKAPEGKKAQPEEKQPEEKQPGEKQPEREPAGTPSERRRPTRET